MEHFSYLNNSRELQDFRDGLLRLKRKYFVHISKEVEKQIANCAANGLDGLKDTRCIDVQDCDEELSCWAELEELYLKLPLEDRYVIARESYLEKYFSFVYWDTVNNLEALYYQNQ